MQEQIQAVCLENRYSYRGGIRIEEPSFIAGETYTFTESHFITQSDGLGNVSAMNERGVESIMSIKELSKGFQILNA